MHSLHSRPQLLEAFVVVSSCSMLSIAVKLSTKELIFASFPRQSLIKQTPSVAEILPGGGLLAFFCGDLNSHRFDNTVDRQFISFNSVGSDENFGQHLQHLRCPSDLTPPVLIN